MSGKIRVTMGLIPYKKEVCLASEFLLTNALGHQSAVLWLITLQPVFHVASWSPTVWRNQEHWAAGPSNATVLFSIGIVIAGTRNKTSTTTTMQTHSVPTSDINPQRLHSLHRNTHGEHHANMLGVMSQGYHGDASCMLNPPILNSCSYNADHDQWAGLSYSSDHARELQKEQILCNGDTSTHSAMEGQVC